MEGPSLLIASEQLQPFIGKKVRAVRGNTKIEKERCEEEQVLGHCRGSHVHVRGCFVVDLVLDRS